MTNTHPTAAAHATRGAAAPSRKAARGRARALPVLCWLLVTAPVLCAQGMVADGSLTLRFDADPSLADSADLIWRGVDHLDRVWFWYRLAGDSAEARLPAPDTQSYSGNLATFGWSNVHGRGFDLQVGFEVFDCPTTGTGAPCMVSGPWGVVGVPFEITNNTASDLQIEFFFYWDVDVNGTKGGDRALYRVDPFVGAEIVGLFEGSTTVTGVRPPTALYRVAAAPLLLDALEDLAVTNFADTGLPFGPGDVTFGFQGSITIAPSDTVLGNQTLLLDWPLFASGLETGDTSAWAKTVP